MTVLTKPPAAAAPAPPGVAPGSAARAERPRLSVFRSNRGVFAQLIDDDARATPWPPSTGSSRSCASSAPSEQAKRAGELLAERAKAAGVETCVFDRGGYQYHGRVKALAEGAREGGLAF